MAKSTLNHIPWIGWLMIILALCLTPGDKLPKIEWELFSIGTMAHFGLYFVLIFLMLAAFLKSKGVSSQKKMNQSNFGLYLLLILIASGIGYAVELMQEKFIYQRYYDTEDIIVNIIGTVFGAFGYTLIGRKLV